MRRTTLIAFGITFENYHEVSWSQTAIAARAVKDYEFLRRVLPSPSPTITSAPITPKKTHCLGSHQYLVSRPCTHLQPPTPHLPLQTTTTALSTRSLTRLLSHHSPTPSRLFPHHLHCTQPRKGPRTTTIPNPSLRAKIRRTLHLPTGAQQPSPAAESISYVPQNPQMRTPPSLSHKRVDSFGEIE